MKDEFFKIFISSIKSYQKQFLFEDMQINYSYKVYIILLIRNLK